MRLVLTTMRHTLLPIAVLQRHTVYIVHTYILCSYGYVKDCLEEECSALLYMYIIRIYVFWGSGF